MGLDRVVYGHAANTVTVDRLDDGALRVQGPGDTVDLLWNIERLRFADITLAFDLAEGQSANQAARVVTALVGSETLSDRPLMRDVVEHMDRLGFEAVTSLLVDSGMAAHYAGSTDIEALVATVFANLQGSNGTAEDLQWHQDFVAEAGWSAVEVLRFAAQHPLAAERMDLVELTGQGLAYATTYYNVFNFMDGS
ncbi:MAG: hypothetical protein EOO29_16625 [Comamonadaceae bacterium]|nr:MAG: hypothetical protein EOO29_16625 [Comamonadaceae bacterium]